jgi:hypothetical protein
MKLTKREKLTQVTIWVDNFWACKSTNQEATDRMMRNKDAIVLSIFDRVPMLDKPNPRVPEPYTIQIMRKRALELKIPFTEAAFTLLALGLLKSSPACAHMYLCAIKHVQATEADNLPLTSQVLLESYLEGRILGQEDLERLWADQKRPGFNLIDMMGPDDFLL